jgi:exosortase J
MQQHGLIADYIIGGCLFVLALTIFFAVADKLRNDPKDVLPELAVETPRLTSQARPLLLKVGAVLAMAAIFGADVVHEQRVDAAASASAHPMPKMPDHVGNFTLVRTWDESQFGVLVYTWGEYAAPAANGTASAHVMLGVSPQTVHDAEVCHIARGEDPTWHGQIVTATAGGQVELTAATYNDGATQKLEASTVCDNGTCRQYSETSQHLTIIYARPHRGVPLQSDTARPIPVLFKVESLDTTSPVSVIEPQLAATLTEFLKGANLPALISPFSKR